MTKINDGGPAFPRSQKAALSPITDVNGDDIQSGMSLRDHFAGMALQGLLANPFEPVIGKAEEDIAKHFSRISYIYADAMIAARSNGEKVNG